MSPRARAAATQFVLMAGAWMVTQRLLDLVPWARRESWPELVATGLAFGAIMAAVEWFRWERRRRRAGERAGRAPEPQP
jgi:hypothetical protein